jgi:hypothetical protein
MDRCRVKIKLDWEQILGVHHKGDENCSREHHRLELFEKRSQRYDWNQHKTKPEKPNHLERQSNNVVWSIVPNVVDRSSITKAVGLPLARESSISFLMLRSAVSVEWLALYTDWYVFWRLLRVKWPCICTLTVRSISLDRKGTPVIGRWFFNSFLSRDFSF